jgi:hypothetical protein
VASSTDGVKLVAVSLDGLIYTSADSGATWMRTSAPQTNSWASVVSSGDGTKLMAVTGSGLLGVYFSSDSGTNWSLSNTPNGDSGPIACSADGTQFAMVPYESGLIDILHFPLPPPPPTTVMPLLGMTSSSNQRVVSWLVPSTSFVLQQNLDLTTTNWTDVPTPPTLNFTNLNYHVTVSPTNGQSFYRLRQH